MKLAKLFAKWGVILGFAALRAVGECLSVNLGNHIFKIVSNSHGIKNIVLIITEAKLITAFFKLNKSVLSQI